MAGSDAQSASLQSPMGAMLTRKGVDGDGDEGQGWDLAGFTPKDLHPWPSLSADDVPRGMLGITVNLKRLQTWTQFSEINHFF